MENLSVRLKKLRKAKGLTISELSKQTGISASTYKEWEAGRQIRGEPYAKLAQVLEVSIHELVTGDKGQVHHVVQLLDQVDDLVKKIRVELYTSAKG